jgi:hypothetical protein
MQSGDELIWGSHFDNRNAAEWVASLHIRTYGELAQYSVGELALAGMNTDEVRSVVRALRQRGLKLLGYQAEI